MPLQKLFYMDVTSDRLEANRRMAQDRLESESTFRTGIEGKNGEFFLAVPRELSLLMERILRLERLISQRFRAMPEVIQGALIRNHVADMLEHSLPVSSIANLRSDYSGYGFVKFLT